MIVFFAKSHYESNFRDYLFPLLRAYLNGGNISSKCRFEIYGIKEKTFNFTDNIDKAQVVILTMSWNYYVKNNKMNLADILINKAKNHDKIVWSVILGDVGVVIPEYENLVVFRMGGYRNKLPSNHKGMPVFITSPEKMNNEYKFQTRKYNSKPIVGFCGHANNSVFDVGFGFFRIVIKNLLNFIGYHKHEVQPYFYAPYMRFKLLRKLNLSDKIITNFILRKKYRAGAKSKTKRNQTAKEFYDNIESSDYVFCMRGAGNFSVRFYETLAMGRIPLYVHTDGLLPLEGKIDWKSHVVWVDYKNRKKISMIVKNFHSSLNESSFQKLQESNRKLFKEKLSMSGFFELQE